MYKVQFDTGTETIDEKDFDNLMDYYLYWGFPFPYFWEKV
jgi:hypothetical protein